MTTKRSSLVPFPAVDGASIRLEAYGATRRTVTVSPRLKQYVSIHTDYFLLRLTPRAGLARQQAPAPYITPKLTLTYWRQHAFCGPPEFGLPLQLSVRTFVDIHESTIEFGIKLGEADVC